MDDMRSYISGTAEKYAFPSRTVCDYAYAFDAIFRCGEAARLFRQQVMLYESGMLYSFKYALANVAKAGDLAGIPRETAYGMYLICLTKHLRELYTLHGLKDAWFDGILYDLKIKNAECLQIKGVSGTFALNWYGRFFGLLRFPMGRLQFEPLHLKESNDYNGIFVESGTFSIGIHIPGGSRLVKDDCMKSLKEAYGVFRPYFADGVVLFSCESWLLAPENKTLLSPESNIVQFMDLFNIIPAAHCIDGDFWRVFGREDCTDIATLPRDNSIRRAYALCAERGEIPHAGLGIIRMKDGKII